MKVDILLTLRFKHPLSEENYDSNNLWVIIPSWSYRLLWVASLCEVQLQHGRADQVWYCCYLWQIYGCSTLTITKYNCNIILLFTSFPSFWLPLHVIMLNHEKTCNDLFCADIILITLSSLYLTPSPLCICLSEVC